METNKSQQHKEMETKKFDATTFFNRHPIYTNRVAKRIGQNDIIRKIILDIEEIDFMEDYYSYHEKMLSFILGNRKKLISETGKDNIVKILEELQKYTPDDKSRFSIIAETVQKVAEKLGFGLGYSNSFHYLYNGCYWEVINADELKELLVIVAERCNFHHHQIRIPEKTESLYNQFVFSSKIPNPEHDKDTIKINLNNGTFTIKGKDKFLAPFNSDDIFKYQLSFDYDPTAQAPMFMDFLNEVLPEKESQMILAEYMGYVLTRNLKLEKCLVLIGSGANGKSVVFDIVTALLGKDNVSSSTLSQLCNENGYFRVNLTNKLLNYSSELGGKNCNPDTVKQLISNEPVMARAPYKEAIELQDYAKMMFNVNVFPKDIEQSPAYFRRFIFLPFNVTIPENKQDKNLAKKIIKKELSGIFNWVLEGLDRILKKEKFTGSPASKKQMAEIMRSTSSINEFLEDNGWIRSDENHEDLKSLYNDYKSFCQEVGRYPIGRNEFSKYLEVVMKFQIKRKATNNATWVFCKRKGHMEDSEIDTLLQGVK